MCHGSATTQTAVLTQKDNADVMKTELSVLLSLLSRGTGELLARSPMG